MSDCGTLISPPAQTRRKDDIVDEAWVMSVVSNLAEH